MKYNPNIDKRRSIRLKGYDDSQAGLYFITICVQNRDVFTRQNNRWENEIKQWSTTNGWHCRNVFQIANCMDTSSEQNRLLANSQL